MDEDSRGQRNEIGDNLTDAEKYLANDLKNGKNERRHTDSYSSIFKTKTLNKKTKRKLHNQSFTSINSFTQTSLSFKNDETQSILFENAETPVPLVQIDYDSLIPNKHTDLTKLSYANNLEKYLITRIYSDVNKLSTLVSQMDHIDLEHFLTTPDENECLPMYYAIKAECVNSIKLLLLKGTGLNRTTKSGDPALHLACLLGASLGLVEFLVSKTDDLYQTDQEGWCSLHCACNQGHLGIVRYLIEKKFMNPNFKDTKTSYTGIQLAAMNGQVHVVDYLLTFQSVTGVKSTTLAEKSNLPSDPKSLNKKLEFFEEANKKVKTKERISLEPTFLYSHDNKKKSPGKFMYNNFLIDIKSQNNEGQNLLHIACFYGQYDIVRTLLKKYASNQLDLNSVDFKGRTCLDLAWIWLIYSNASEAKSILYDPKNYFYMQEKELVNNEKIDREVKLLFLLVSFGAKFSSQKQILFKKYISNSMYQMDQNLSEKCISIQVYLKLVYHLFKLNLPTLFLQNKVIGGASNENQNSGFDRLELAKNFQEIRGFVDKNVFDSLEKQIYLNEIIAAFEALARIQD
ncbi:ankyrin repeat [Brachionus plicatilis]|uniref:Ankyrin repeat n=1 Tax=Brachionus plicatilis TaxID=10195 RepID=A0A3M7R3F3_BRAPC|nr:ankyrin repeat [Brachionus plicatilis]